MLREAADQGHVEAQGICGNLYTLSRGVAQDDRLAFLYFEKAAQQGEAACQTCLGTFYLRGQGCEKSCERAAEWLKRAASAGRMDAQCMLAHLYEHGLGVAKDYLEARRLYTLASAQGHAHATELLKGLEEKIRTECPLLGKRVKITGTSRGDLNGRVGVARSFDEAKGRYVVELDREGDGPEASKEHLVIKSGNLVIAHDHDSNAVRKKENKGGKRKGKKKGKGK